MGEAVFGLGQGFSSCSSVVWYGPGDACPSEATLRGLPTGRGLTGAGLTGGSVLIVRGDNRLDDKIICCFCENQSK